MLEGTDAALKPNGTGHNYGATGTDPVNGRIEQKGAANGAVTKDKAIEINIEQKQKANSEPQGKVKPHTFEHVEPKVCISTQLKYV